jgi:hypothetical protein
MVREIPNQGFIVFPSDNLPDDAGSGSAAVEYQAPTASLSLLNINDKFPFSGSFWSQKLSNPVGQPLFWGCPKPEKVINDKNHNIVTWEDDDLFHTVTLTVLNPGQYVGVPATIRWPKNYLVLPQIGTVKFNNPLHYYNRDTGLVFTLNDCQHLTDTGAVQGYITMPTDGIITGLGSHAGSGISGGEITKYELLTKIQHGLGILIHCNQVISLYGKTQVELPGTISISGNTITGTGTNFTTHFTTANEGNTGKSLHITVSTSWGFRQTFQVASVNSDTSITTVETSDINESGVKYGRALGYTGPATRTDGYARDRGAATGWLPGDFTMTAGSQNFVGTADCKFRSGPGANPPGAIPQVQAARPTHRFVAQDITQVVVTGGIGTATCADSAMFAGVTELRLEDVTGSTGLNSQVVTLIDQPTGTTFRFNTTAPDGSYTGLNAYCFEATGLARGYVSVFGGLVALRLRNVTETVLTLAPNQTVDAAFILRMSGGKSSVSVVCRDYYFGLSNNRSSYHNGIHPNVQYGTVLYIPAAVTEASLGLTHPITKNILQALKTYQNTAVDDTASTGIGLQLDNDAYAYIQDLLTSDPVFLAEYLAVLGSLHYATAQSASTPVGTFRDDFKIEDLGNIKARFKANFYANEAEPSQTGTRRAIDMSGNGNHLTRTETGTGNSNSWMPTVTDNEPGRLGNSKTMWDLSRAGSRNPSLRHATLFNGLSEFTVLIVAKPKNTFGAAGERNHLMATSEGRRLGLSVNNSVTTDSSDFFVARQGTLTGASSELSYAARYTPDDSHTNCIVWSQNQDDSVNQLTPRGQLMIDGFVSNQGISASTNPWDTTEGSANYGYTPWASNASTVKFPATDNEFRIGSIASYMRSDWLVDEIIVFDRKLSQWEMAQANNWAHKQMYPDNYFIAKEDYGDSLGEQGRCRNSWNWRMVNASGNRARIIDVNRSQGGLNIETIMAWAKIYKTQYLPESIGRYTRNVMAGTNNPSDTGTGTSNGKYVKVKAGAIDMLSNLNGGRLANRVYFGCLLPVAAVGGTAGYQFDGTDATEVVSGGRNQSHDDYNAVMRTACQPGGDLAAALPTLVSFIDWGDFTDIYGDKMLDCRNPNIILGTGTVDSITTGFVNNLLAYTPSIVVTPASLRRAQRDDLHQTAINDRVDPAPDTRVKYTGSTAMRDCALALYRTNGDI